MDNDAREYLRASDEMRLAAKELQRAFDAKVEAATYRYQVDPEFHARVYQLAQVIENDTEYRAWMEQADPDETWALSIRLGLKVLVAAAEQRPGGLLDLTVRQ